MKDADGIRNVCQIIQRAQSPLTVVVSAIGDSTNRLEAIAEAYVDQDCRLEERCQQFREYHYEVVNDLFRCVPVELKSDIESVFDELLNNLSKTPGEDYDYEYDQIIGVGELLSTHIVSAYLCSLGADNVWVDVRSCLKSDSCFRDANLDWDLSKELVQNRFVDDDKTLYITQGFIASDKNGNTTSLGREGSDYTASILAYLLGAEKMVIWKDVLGILNADPDYFSQTVKLDLIPYKEAIELSYYGARVIHPKTIKPLQARTIPLWVKSFLDPSAEGTLISVGDNPQPLLPNYIVKKRQVLITLHPLNFSFVGEKDLFFVFSLITKYRIKLNFSQNTAVSFAFCVDHANRRLGQLVKELKDRFDVVVDEKLELITVRHYDTHTLETISRERDVLIEQKNKNTAIYLVS